MFRLLLSLFTAVLPTLLFADDARVPHRRFVPDDPAAHQALKAAGATTERKTNRLTKHTFVTKLKLHRKTITPDLLSNIARLPQCTEVRIIHSSVSDEAFISLSKATQLKTLVLQDTGMTDRGLQAVSELKLHELRSIKSHLTDDGLSPLADMVTLAHLNLVAAPITDKGIATLGKVSSLRTLDISHTRISDKGIHHLSKLSHLQTLAIVRTNVSFAGLAPLSTCDNLRCLYLSSTPSASDADINAANGLKRLRILTFKYSVVTDDSLVAISHLPALEELVIGDADVTPSGIMQLSRIETLKKLDLPNNISSSAIKPLLKDRPSLEVLIGGFPVAR